MTSTTRMLFAFSRDGAVPGRRYWRKLNTNRVPVYGVILTAVVAVILTLPALVKVDIGGAPVPVAFFAVVSIGVIGLYVAFAIPIYLRWRAGVELRRRQLDNRLEVQVDVHRCPGRDRDHLDHRVAADVLRRHSVELRLRVEVRQLHDHRGTGALFLLWVWWHLSVKNWFTGPKHTIDDVPEQTSVTD